MNHLKNIYLIQKQLKKDAIVDAVSRMIQRMSFEEKGGMMEVGGHHIKDIDELLAELGKIEDTLANIAIDSM